MTGAPTLVLVHGAWYSPETWTPLRESLADIETVAVGLTSTGADPAALGDMARDAAHIREVVDAIDGPVVAVAHSYGGIPTTEGLAGAANVERLVYVTSLQLDVGDSLMSSIGGWAPDWWLFDHEAGTMSVDTPIEAFFADVDPETAAWAAAGLSLQSIASFEQPLTRAAWQTIPSTYVVTTEDVALPADLQRAMAQRSQRIHEMSTAHSPFLSRTDELAGILRAECAELTAGVRQPR